MIKLLQNILIMDLENAVGRKGNSYRNYAENLLSAEI